MGIGSSSESKKRKERIEQEEKERNKADIIKDIKKILNNEEKTKINKKIQENKVSLEYSLKSIVARGYLIAFLFYIHTHNHELQIVEEDLKSITNKIITYILDSSEQINTNNPMDLIVLVINRYFFHIYESLYNLIKHRLNINDCYVNLDSSLVLPLIYKINLYDCLPEFVINSLPTECKNIREIFTINLFLEIAKESNKEYQRQERLRREEERLRLEEQEKVRNEINSLKNSIDSQDDNVDSFINYENFNVLSNEDYESIKKKFESLLNNTLVESFQNMNEKSIKEIIFSCFSEDIIINNLYPKIKTHFNSKANNELKSNNILNTKTIEDLDNILFKIEFIDKFGVNISSKIINRLDSCKNKIEYFKDKKYNNNNNVLIKTLLLSITFYLLNNKNVSKIVKKISKKITKDNLLILNSIIFIIIYLLISMFV